MSMGSTRVQDGSMTIETPGRRPIYSLFFAEEGNEVISGGVERKLRRWRVDDGHEVGQPVRTEGAEIFSADLSANCRWLVCGLRRSNRESDGGGEVVRVWDMRTHREVQVDAIRGHKGSVFSIHVSCDSTRFVTGSADMTACIWSTTTGERLVGPLRHEGVVVAVRFSPDGLRIATATAKNPEAKSIRIYNSSDGQRLLNIPFLIHAHISSSLAWSGDGRQLFAVAYSEVKCFDTSSGSLLSQWPVPGSGSSASIVLSPNQKFVAVVAFQSLSLWDTVTHKQIGTAIEHTSPVWSITLSPDDCHIVTGENNGKITFRCLRNVLPDSYITVNLPLMYISDAAFRSWSQNDFVRAEELLTEDTAHPFHRAHALAQRALVRIHMKQWNLAIDDAKESIKIQQSMIGYIAVAMAYLGSSEYEVAMSVFDLAFSVDIPGENIFLLLIKAIILFEYGKRDEAKLRIDSLIDIVDDQSLYTTVRAQMFLILGDMALRKGDHEQALEFFRRAKEAIPFPNDPHLVVISLIFGWVFDQFELVVQLCLHKCIKPFEDCGDAEMQSECQGEAVMRYSTALSLNPSNPAGLLVKRSRALAMLGLWEDALKDADEAIKADPLDARGYERRHAALHGMQHYDEAIIAFTRMLSLMEESPDQDVRRLGEKYITPTLVETTIRETIREVICPLVLIDVESGRLCDGMQRLNRFKSGSSFKQLISSMTEVLDKERIQRVVEEYFRYVTFSHVWEGEEPSFQAVILAGSVWKLDSSPLHEKLKGFCKVVQKDGYLWAWSDTCCIDKTSSTVLSQSITMMYKWYEASAATFVFLAGVESPSVPGALTDSLWMTRVWTAQELLAPKIIRFYDRDWRPYLGDMRHNHKKSPEIMQEVANAIGIAREIITTFHPDNLIIREKLRLASTRNASVEEDKAYALIGIFKSDIRPHYGEGGAVALGHLLAGIVTRSGDATILDWTGKPSTYNSCLPATLAVYSQLPYASPEIKGAEMNMRVATLRTSLSQSDITLIYDRVTRLPSARFANRRLHLPCLVFTVKKLRTQNSGGGHYSRAWVTGIGHVAFQTSDELTEPRRLVLVHPWIRNLCDPLDRLAWGSTVEHDWDDSDSETETRSAPSKGVPAAATDDYTRALQLIVRLHQPFRALLLQQQPDGEFKRIAAEHEIMVPGLDRQVNFARDIRAETVEIL